MSSVQKRSIFKYLILLLFLADTVYTFKQNYGKPIDGDLVEIILPCDYYTKVLTDPFGIDVLLHKERYYNTGRFFAHKTTQIWFTDVNKIIAVFFKDKVTALYVTSALFNTLVYILIVLLLALYINLFIDLRSFRFLLAILIIFPFIQIHGYSHNTAIIDEAITYTFFYGFLLCVLMIYLYPFYKYAITGQKEQLSFSLVKNITWILLAIYLSFSGPLIQPLILLFSGFLFCYLLLKESTLNPLRIKISLSWYKDIPLAGRVHYLILFVLCLYSYYIGLFNLSNPDPLEMPSLTERYALLWTGIKLYFTCNLAYALFAILLIVNFFLLKKMNLKQHEKNILKYSRMLLLFSVIYIAVLPFGAYRSYRPYIIRYDVVMPITIIILFYATFTSWIIIQQHDKKYFIFLTTILLIFQLADKPHFHNNACEKKFLRILSKTKSDTLIFPKGCTILEWVNSDTYERTQNKTKILQRWGITNRPVYYIQQ